MTTANTNQTNPPRRAKAYLRVSTGSQGDSGLGLEAQKAQIESYAASRGLSVIAWFEDVVSGKTHPDARPGLNRLMKSLQPDETVLVAKRDRMSRDLMLSLWIDKEISRLSCNLESSDGAANGTSPTDVLLKQMILAFSEFERNLISERTKAALSQLKGRKTLGRAPFGYRHNADGQLEPVPEQIKTLARIEELHREGINPNAIATLVNDEGHSSQTGRPFSRNTIFSICQRLDQTRMNQEQKGGGGD